MNLRDEAKKQAGLSNEKPIKIRYMTEILIYPSGQEYIKSWKVGKSENFEYKKNKNGKIIDEEATEGEECGF